MRRIFMLLVLVLAALVLLPPLWFVAFPAPKLELPAAGHRVSVGDGLAVNAVVKGTGPPVVLIHGLPGTAYDWAPLHETLATRGYGVLAYDRIGYGRSDARGNSDFSVAANAGELLAVLESEGLQDATVVGWSYGGSTSMTAALRDSSRIARLVLIGSGGYWEDPVEPPAIFAIWGAPVLRWVGWVPPAARGIQASISTQAFSDQPAPDWWLPQVEASFQREATVVSWMGEGAQFSWEGPDPTPIERPILVIHGDDDRLVPLEVAEWLHAHSQRGKLMVVEGGSHMLPVTHPKALAERIVAFIQGE